MKQYENIDCNERVTIKNIPEPIEDGDASNKIYVDEKVITSKNIVVTTAPAGLGITVGSTIPTGSDLTDFIEQVFAPYTPPSFSAFVINGDISGTLEVGQTLTITNATFTQTNDSEGNPPSDKNIIGTGFESATLVVSSPHVADAVVKTTVRTTAGTQSWSIVGKDKNDVNISRTGTRTWYYKFMFGASSINVTDNVNAKTVYDSLQQSWLQANKTRTATATADNANGSNFTYIIYPTSFGDLSNIIQNGATPVLTAFTKLGTFTFNNVFGIETIFNVYKSNATGAFLTGTTLTIS